MISKESRVYLQIAGLLLSSAVVAGCAKDSFLSGLAPTGLPKMTEPDLEETDLEDTVEDSGEDSGEEDEKKSKRVAEKDAEE